MFDKNAQRLRAEEFAMNQLAKGVKPVPPMPLPIHPPMPKPILSKMNTEAWPGRLAPAVNPGYPYGTINDPKPKKVKKLSYEARPVMNHFNQILNPGCKVIAVTPGRSGDIKIREGIYLGARQYGDGTSAFVVRVREFKRGTWHERQTTLAAKRVYPTT